MKIIEISSLQEQTPPQGYGGTERFVHAFSNELSDRGHDVTVVCKEGSLGGKYKKVYANNGAAVISAIKALDKTEYPDLLHLNTKDKDLIEFLKSLNIPVVCTFHNNFRSTSGWIKIIRENPDNFFFSTISENLKKRTEEALITNNVVIPTHKITNLGFGMETELYTSNIQELPKENYVYIGVIARYKGVLDIVKAFLNTDKKLVLVGPTHTVEEKQYLAEILNTVGDNKNITCYGETSNEKEKIDLILKSYALVIATGIDPKEADCHEAFGLVMLEANALGIPVIGFAKGNVTDYIVNGQNGIKFDSFDNFLLVLKNIEEKDWKNSCIERSKLFDIRRVADSYENFFKEIIA